jgi:hypothetical protein
MSAITEFYGCRLEIGTGVDRPKHLHDLAAAFEILKPKASPRPLVRIGPNYDGGYLIPDDLEGVEACFSPGVSNRKDFEDHLTRIFGIKCHMCDYSSDEEKLKTSLIEGNQTFRKAWLDINGAKNSIRLDEWIEQISPDAHADLLLQMDIEGAEYRNVLSCPAKVLSRFRIMVLEIHGMGALLNYNVLEQVLLPFLCRIDESFVCVHAHPNNCCGEFTIPELGANMPHVLELTFLRKDRLATATGRELVPPLLPHPMDILRNVREKPPLFLNDAWVNGNRPLPSRVTRLEYELDYQKYRDVQSPVQFNRLLEAAVKLTLRASAASHHAGSGGNVLADEGPADLEEIAVGCTYVLSSSFENNRMSGTVPDYGGNFFFHTNFGLNQSITVDLGTIRTVRLVTIENRRDGCYDRARLLFLILHTEENKDCGDVFFIDAPAGFVTGRGVGAKIPLPPIDARYVTILSPLQTALHFSSLRVFGKPRGMGAA